MYVCLLYFLYVLFFFFKQKTAYEMRISDWSSDVCSSDLGLERGRYDVTKVLPNGKVELSDGRRKIRFDPQKLSPTEKRDRLELTEKKDLHQIGRASCRERVCK